MVEKFCSKLLVTLNCREVMNTGLSVSVNKELRQAATKAKRKEPYSKAKWRSPYGQWSKDLDSVTRKPEENSATKPDPSLQKIKVTCQCGGLLWANQNTSLPAFRAVSLAQTSRCRGWHLYTLSWQLKDLVISSNLRETTQSFSICIRYI